MLTVISDDRRQAPADSRRSRTVDVKTFGVQDYLTAHDLAGAALLAGVVRSLAAVSQGTASRLSSSSASPFSTGGSATSSAANRLCSSHRRSSARGGGGRASGRALGTTLMDVAKMTDFATRYTAAWCSQDAASVASFFAANGSLKINHGSPSVGRAEITCSAGIH